jgi:uncharacterized protein (TIGR03435 family)
MAALADTLHDFAGGYLDHPVIDETNLAGAWNFTIKWTPRNQLEKQGADGISIFAAVERQLGLKLELKTAPRPVFRLRASTKHLLPMRTISPKPFRNRPRPPSRSPR